MMTEKEELRAGLDAVVNRLQSASPAQARTLLVRIVRVAAVSGIDSFLGYLTRTDSDIAVEHPAIARYVQDGAEWVCLNFDDTP